MKNNLKIVNSKMTNRDDEGYIYYDGILFTGTEEWRYETGELGTSTEYLEGVLNGPMIGWYKSGQKRSEKFYSNGRVIGIVRKWAENGQIMFEQEISNGKALWTKEWDESGKLVKDSIRND